jgi:capsular polysaccharide transport system permease protein
MIIDPIRIPKHPPWVTQILVLRALLGREMVTRFGKYHLGFFWMLLEPLVSVIVIGLMVGSLLGRTVPEIPYVFFLLNGFLLLKLFTGPMTSGINAISANRGLLVYPSVRPLDPLLARFIFELLTTMFSFVVFCMIGMWMGISLSLDALHVLLATFLITWFAGCGFGLIFCVASAYFKEAEKIVVFFQRPLLFVSAVLVPTSALPVAAKEILLYNPLVHTIEISRSALFPLYQIDGVNLFYPFSFAIIVFAVGISYFQNNQHFLSQLKS